MTELIRSYVDSWELWTVLTVQVWVLCAPLVLAFRQLWHVSPLNVLVSILQFRNHHQIACIEAIGRWLGIHLSSVPIWTTVAVAPATRSAHPLATTPKGPESRSRGQGRTARLGRSCYLTSMWQMWGVLGKSSSFQRELPICWLMPAIAPCLAFAFSSC